MSPIEWLLALVITAVAAALQGIVGMGYGLLAVPLLAVLDPQLAPVPQLLTMLPLTVVMAWRERHALDLHGVGWLLAGRVPGAALGLTLLAVATQRTLDMTIGIVVLVAVAVLGGGFHVKRTRAAKFGAGVASGVTSLVSSIGGPPVAMLYTAAEAATIRSTLAAVFAIGASFTALVRAFSGNVSGTDLTVTAALFPAVLAGWLLSLRHKEVLPRARVRMAILGISAAAAVGLIVRAAVG